MYLHEGANESYSLHIDSCRVHFWLSESIYRVFMTRQRKGIMQQQILRS